MGVLGKKGSIASFGTAILLIVRDDKLLRILWRTRRLGESPFSIVLIPLLVFVALVQTGSDDQSTQDTMRLPHSFGYMLVLVKPGMVLVVDVDPARLGIIEIRARQSRQIDQETPRS
jgi:hypothetical protein